MQAFRISQIKSYFLAGRLLHLICILELFLIYLLLPLILEIKTNGTISMIILKIFLAGYIISLPILSQLDARSRFQNYKQIKDQFYIYGYNTRILMPVLKSRCQRDAALVSAKELGLYHKCNDFFQEHGYRLYHIIPDFVFKKPQFLVTKYFWLTTFFAPTYRAKINFSTISRQNIKSRFNLETVHV